jgi:hypothetical protein
MKLLIDLYVWLYSLLFPRTIELIKEQHYIDLDMLDEINRTAMNSYRIYKNSVKFPIEDQSVITPKGELAILRGVYVEKLPEYRIVHKESARFIEQSPKEIQLELIRQFIGANSYIPRDSMKNKKIDHE